MRYKVIQWSTGNVGKGVIRAIAERENLELAGVLVFSDDKNGVDAGEIAGIGELGVKATTSVDDIIALDADVVMHTPLPSLVYGDEKDADLDNFCRLLEAGKNVITTVGYMYPKVHGAEVVKRLEDACMKGNTSFHGTGVNPGWVGDVFPLTMSACSKTIHQIYTREISSFQAYPSPEIMFGIMGFNKTDEEFDRDIARQAHWLNGLFRENIQMVADGLDIELDEIVDTLERSYAPHDLETAAGVVRKGTIAGQHYKWAGLHKGHEAEVHETFWRMHDDVSPDWPTGLHCVEIKGQGHMKIEFEWGLLGEDILLSTGMHGVNAIPTVCAAAPGVQTLIDLPWIMGKGAFRLP
ncbi:MAG: dihydrodipicolinate reductase, partial [Pseudomonadota bacterium]